MGAVTRFNLLPMELQLKIFQHLNYKDAYSVQKACGVAPLQMKLEFHITGVKAAEAFLAYIKHRPRLFFKRLIIAPVKIKFEELASMRRVLSELAEVCMDDLRVERFVFLWRKRPYDASPIIRNLKPSQVTVDYDSFRLIADIRGEGASRTIFPFVSRIKILYAPYNVFSWSYWYRCDVKDTSEIAESVFPNAKLLYTHLTLPEILWSSPPSGFCY